MKPKKRQKLCHNCEGDIDVDVIVCPFCAADLREEKPEQKSFPYTPSPATSQDQGTMQSLYPPPYKTSLDPLPEEDPPAPSSSDSAEGQEKNIFVPTILFTLGVQICLLGLLMLLFSHKGLVILRWDARFWFLYVAGSIPFLVLGYKKL